ncbi:carbonic anhydrase [Streptomyces gulbargensis]|uniref:carbonic anhydrase n=1 Tax=Streptomyces gulbargensis TaxID=364901 RepID=A0ABP7L855_9ACTN
MQPLTDNARSRGQRPEEFAPLAAGQSPTALFITCSDARVAPALLTAARPGEHVELRTAGSIVPPYHSHCGAVGALVRGDDLSGVPAVRDRLAHAAPDGVPGRPDDPAVADAVRAPVLAQLLRLRSYPCVDRRRTEGRPRLRSRYDEVHTGVVREYRTRTDSFDIL